MAKIRHNNIIDTFAELSDSAKSQGVIQLYTEDEYFTGRHVTINQNKLLHFGTTGYLGLEQDERVKKAAVDAIMKYGTQFPLSKTYLSHSLYAELEEKLLQMYGYEVIITKNSTLGHMGVMPTIVRDQDAIILDHQVHWSVQNVSQIIKAKGLPIEMVKHNDMDMLESRIKKLSQSRQKIWYFADGIYSMYGDVAPIGDLKTLSAKYPQLHLYFDDVHGMSWTGKNGTGYVIQQYGDELPENVIVFTTLSKTFGASGATMVTSNKQFRHHVKSFGGPLTFSAQLEPSSVGAAIASANIHLSEEIYQMQDQLHERINYCNELLSKTDLPLLETNDCPVFFIGTGAPAMAYSLMHNLFESGFYANIGLFPAVPVKKTGIRFTISRHNNLSDIKDLVDALESGFTKSLKELGQTHNHIRKIFDLSLVKDDIQLEKKHTELTVNVYESINDVNETDWNNAFKGKNVLDTEGLKYLERTFANNSNKEENWVFRYVLIYDRQRRLVMATFFTKALWKNDMFALEDVSKELEAKRANDPYYQSSYALLMGSLFTEGNHLFLDSSHPDFAEAINLLFDKVEVMDEVLKPEVIAFRDFSDLDEQLKLQFEMRGFIRTTIPDACTLDLTGFSNKADYLNSLSSRSRKHFKKDIEPFIDQLNIKVTDQLSKVELDKAYSLYLNVWQRNYSMNTFVYPKKFIEEMNGQTGWEFIMLSDPITARVVGVMFCYKNSGETYVPAFIGMDYDFDGDFSVYRQLLYQTLIRAKELLFKEVDYGFSASFEKHKIGAKVIPKVAYMQAKDNYSMEMLETISNTAS
ncbi:MAG: aminotransferase class I/II-fold pyridoxal phosphate-dependent enzyme [Marinoscillum sp.]